MDETKQNAFRTEIILFYEKRAFEQLALYDYWGQKYLVLDKTITDLEARGAEAKKMSDELQYNPNRTVETKARIKSLLEDVYKYKERVKSVAKMREDLFKRATSYQVEAGTALEQVEHFKRFKVKTPEQIEADKTKPVETTS